MAAAKKAAAKPPRQRVAAPATRKTVKSRQIGYYNQSTGFTCGPSSLMMALNDLDPKIKIARPLELQLWHEATTTFMGNGHGGCGALGLALAAKRRGELGQTARDQTGRIISYADFKRMTVYGPKKERATVLVRHG
ncbi:MAG TPA: peptidase C39 family protein [Dongiaceae bacterium]